MNQAKCPSNTIPGFYLRGIICVCLCVCVCVFVCVCGKLPCRGRNITIKSGSFNHNSIVAIDVRGELSIGGCAKVDHEYHG